jgi:hypothetical protein
MPESLLDRIICALLPLRCDLEEPCEECRILACQDAEAVIAALGLTKEDEYNPYDPFPPPYRIRYVTEWATDKPTRAPGDLRAGEQEPRV